MTKGYLLVIDDEPDIGAFLCEAADRFGFEAVATDNPDDFWSRYDAVEPVVIILDLKMPQVDGVELLRKLAARNSKAQIVMMSGADQRVLQTALRLGNDRGLRMLGTLQKPIRVGDIQKVFEGISARVMPVGESELHQAIDANQIIVHYQPKADLLTDCAWKISGCEALARWDHPARGLLGPEKFIALAEKTDLIGPLTDLILRQTVEQLAVWRDRGISLSAAMNLSPCLLSDIKLPDRYHDLCRSFGVEPAWLTLEITESGAMSDAALTMDILTRFRLKGFGLSLDDFGTGYSSLVQLHRMPFNEMKIDKSFVIESDNNEEAVQIIRSIAGLANNLKLSLCAEGVESDKALALVRGVGCHTVQGYLIGKPMPADNLSAFIRSRTGMKNREPTDYDGESGST